MYVLMMNETKKDNPEAGVFMNDVEMKGDCKSSVEDMNTMKMPALVSPTKTDSVVSETTITDEQRLRMKNNKEEALKKKQTALKKEVEAMNTTKMPALVSPTKNDSVVLETTITDEQRLRMKKNKEEALKKKQAPLKKKGRKPYHI